MVDGLCGPGAGADFGLGQSGIASVAFDTTSMDTVDFIGGPNSKVVDTDPCGFQNPAGAHADVDAFGLRALLHAEANLLDLVRRIAKDLGLVRVPQILTGQRVLDRDWEDGIQPVSAWAGVTTGAMPFGHTEGGYGRTRMFRHFYHIGKKEWPWSTPELDRDAIAYLDVSGMSWHYTDVGDFESQLLVRMVASKMYDRNYKPLVLHRKAARALVCKAGDILRRCRPSQLAVRTRAASIADEPEVFAPPVVAEEERRPAVPAASGGDLLSALCHPVETGMKGLTALGLPALQPAMSTVIVSLPARRR